MSRARSIRQAAKAKRSILPTVEDYSCVHEFDAPTDDDDEAQADHESDAYWLDSPNAEDISYLDARRMHG